ncbi:synaptotagmin-2 [Sparus aurata]|uniref:C2 domain-containing protein n=1 Tax=Sparus aurata TaxID=8175 RepID=A0A671VVV8_SPAAU|nr:synaptotagmin-2-like [Sparus aurata]XP_030282725.1 synaptotagmin-2-like [Sparus aurata]XP_030282726.1 synaptotagmin-2-like [Sparus aurata]XP_030282727.1 synaptotagmin-2-like [Sparus aurata]XP_030282728.1 synaptotagmin-2-like [Sparus aurata]XP_030282729.1 synaptotagmin-2-like [Sparus aurata]XP_030282730.1 synaptotagmin-2-like [Sparus aurata]
MAVLIDFPAPVGHLSSAGDVRMPFSDTVKYCILGISVTLLLVALVILAWQIFRCCTQSPSTHMWQDTVSSDLLYTEEKSRRARNHSGAPSTRVEEVSTEVGRLDRCLSQTLCPPTGSNQTDRHVEEQDKVDGSLRFSIYYDQLQSQLVVTVLQVEGLHDRSQKHSLQPFVKLSLMWAGSEGVELGGSTDEEGEGSAPVLWAVLQEWRTRVVKGSCNPLFGDQFSCVLHKHRDFDRISLRMEVRDFDKFSRHTVLGEVRVPLGKLNISYPLELQEDLQIPQKDLGGEVLLSLKVLPTAQRLEVGLLKVRTVLTEISSDAALYARISVQCNHCKSRHQKTSAVARRLVTVFNEVLLFSLPDFPLQQCKIVVCVYEMQTTRMSNKHLIGQLTVGKEKSSEDEHWSLMMRSVRQPIAKWHGLLI